MYLNWDTKIITDFSSENIEKMYDEGYVFTRVGKGVMNKVRSFRIKLSDFEPSSENRRILKKAENIKLETNRIPFKKYTWHIGKMAKDFYTTRGAEFSANKIKELLTDKDETNFNTLLGFKNGTVAGYAICYESENILHYSYPFYKEDKGNPSLGLEMMLMAINYAKKNGKKYIYLGSLQRPSDTYKLQFSGQEWSDGNNWLTDITPLKNILK